MTTTPTCDLTPSDMFMSLNGFDEIAITKAFGADISELKDNTFRFVRALVFVAERRTGSKDAEAYKAAMSLTIGAATDYFQEEDETDELDEDSDAGKDAEPSN